MIQTITLSPGVTLRHYPDTRFKKCALSFQLLRPMCQAEAAHNALLPAVLLRGTLPHPDLRTITWRLDELYGASVNTMVRRIGDIQTVGFYLSLLEERFALDGDQILAPAIDFLRELLLEPITDGDAFDPEFVASEKVNLISAIESEINDKRAYAAGQLLRRMCAGDSFAQPRLGTAQEVEAITPEGLYGHYRRILGTSPVEICYVGAAPAQTVARLLMPLAQALAGQKEPIPAQTPFTPQTAPADHAERMDVTQCKLSMGFVTPVTNRHPDFAAMQVCNALFGAGMTSKLFVHVRERLSLCYYASSSYYGSKGILTVSSGVEEEHLDTARGEILRQLSLCAQGQITREELEAAKSAIISSLRATPDSPGALEGYYATSIIAGTDLDLPTYIAAVEAVTAEDVVRCAAGIRLHTVYVLKGETP